MSPEFRDPLDGKPSTAEAIGADGLPLFRIRPLVLTPLRAKIADACAWVMMAALAVGCIGLFFTHRSHGFESAVVLFAALLGAWLAAWPLVTCGLRLAFRRRTEIEMTTDGIAVRTWRGWQRYSRLLEHRFAHVLHDLAAQEYRENDFKGRKAAASGRVIHLTPYYGESFHVVLLYAGHRVDLLTVFGQKDMAAIIARLQYCDRRLNEALAMGGGIPRRPADEWHEAPGGIAP
jgi:hypothetical protein